MTGIPWTHHDVQDLYVRAARLVDIADLDEGRWVPRTVECERCGEEYEPHRLDGGICERCYLA